MRVSADDMRALDQDMTDIEEKALQLKRASITLEQGLKQEKAQIEKFQRILKDYNQRLDKCRHLLDGIQTGDAVRDEKAPKIL
ncbi:unnamed protein product [Auanema sp. JU1783]|nr:unnamed protein product [Auanema sp. JU1783]